jgi:hypothetical protein
LNIGASVFADRRVRFHVQLAGDAEAREEYVAGDPYAGSLILIRV